MHHIHQNMFKSPSRGHLSRRHCAPDSANQGQLALLLYSKPDCSLCDGLKDKLSGLIARSQFIPSTLSLVSLQVIDINEKEELKATYDLEVPVLMLSTADGSLFPIPRPPPRITADRLQTHIEKSIAELQQG